MLSCAGPNQPAQPRQNPWKIPNPQEPPISDPRPGENEDLHDPIEPQPIDETDVSVPAIEQNILDEGMDIDGGRPLIPSVPLRRLPIRPTPSIH